MLFDDYHHSPLSSKGFDLELSPYLDVDFDVIQATQRDLLEVLVGSMPKLRAKRFKQAFNKLLQETWDKMDFKKILNNEIQALINLIYV